MHDFAVDTVWQKTQRPSNTPASTRVNELPAIFKHRFRIQQTLHGSTRTCIILEKYRFIWYIIVEDFSVLKKPDVFKNWSKIYTDFDLSFIIMTENATKNVWHQFRQTAFYHLTDERGNEISRCKSAVVL